MYVEKQSTITNKFLSERFEELLTTLKTPHWIPFTLKELKYSETKKYFTRLYIKCVAPNIVINFDIKSDFIYFL